MLKSTRKTNQGKSLAIDSAKTKVTEPLISSGQQHATSKVGERLGNSNVRSNVRHVSILNPLITSKLARPSAKLLNNGQSWNRTIDEVSGNCSEAKSSNSLARKLTPLKLVRSGPSQNGLEFLTLCPVRKIQGERSETSRNIDRDSLLSSTSKIDDVPSYDPSLARTSTVVTMTNNMNAIREHGNKSRDGSQKELIELINNVHRGKAQISNAFASVEGEKSAAQSTDDHNADIEHFSESSSR